jgi:uncharacterized phage infection (PIP) family protein YhgE
LDTSQTGRLEGRKLTDDTVTSVDNGDNLEAFEAEFYGTAKAVVEEAPQEEEVADLGEDENPPATDEDAEEAEAADAEPESDEDEDEVEEPQPKKNKVSARERIEQLNKQVREAERREADYLRRMEQLEAAIKEKASEEQVPLREQLPAKAPNPDAKDENGDAIYPLGEFDGQYIADLAEYTINEKMKAVEERRQQEERQREFQQAQEALKNEWIDKLEKYEEEVPEVRENIRELTDTFSSLDPGYGEFLATSLMGSEYGPQIMNYLSQNIGEAQKIVNSGPAGALFAFGRLEAMFTKPAKSEERKEKKMSKAPAPPEDRNRGTGGKFAVRPDTDNLDAFEKAFFS